MQRSSDMSITFLVPREDDATINPLHHHIHQYKKAKEVQIKAVINYVQDQNQCKHVQLLTYFGETTINACGKCSTCLKKQPENLPSTFVIKQKIRASLQSSSKSSRELTSQLNINEQIIFPILRNMLDDEEIILNPTNKFELIK